MTIKGISRRTFALVGAASLVALIAGCGGGGGGGGTTADTTVTGVLRDSADGDLQVEGATIVMGGVTGTTITRANVSTGNEVGTFRLINVPVGTNTAIITFLNTRVVDSTTTPVTTEKFTDTQTVAFQPSVARGSNAPLELFVNIGQVTGRVLLPGGVAASGAFVTIAPDGIDVTTDAQGFFLAENVSPGAVEIAAVIGTASGSKTLTVGNGVAASGDLQLVEDPNPNPPGSPATVVGKVTTASGASGAGASVLLSRGGNQIEQTITNASGDFSFYVPVGDYSVRVLKDGFVDNSASGAVTNPNTPLRLDVVLTQR